MATRRLSDTMRKAICAAMMLHGFKAREEALEQEFKKLGDRVWHDLYPKKVRDYMENMPEGALPQETSFSVRFGASHHEIPFSIPRTVFFKHFGHHTAVTYEGNHALAEAFHELRAQERSLAEERQDAKTRARGLLNAAPNIKRLLEAWPEVAPFVKEYVEAPTKAIVDPRSLRKLNKDLGLPVGEAS